MAQFKAYRNPNKTSRRTYPYLLDIQSDLLSELNTTVVIPLCPEKMATGAAISKLCPILEIDGKTFVAFTQQMAGISRKALGPEAADLSNYRQEIIAALDFVISGI